MTAEPRRVEGAGGVGLVVDVVAGTKPIGFLLVHGLASNARLWDGVVRELTAGGFASAAVDLRGHGRSDKPDEGYDYQTLCADLVAVMSAFARGTSVAGIVAVGQSFGGNLVLELAARRPEHLVGAACVDGGTFDLAARFETFEEAERVLSPPRIAGTAADTLEARVREWHPDWPEEGIRATMANFEIRPDGTVAPFLTLGRHIEILRTMWSSRPGDLYGRIGVPVLLMPAESAGVDPTLAAEKRDGVAAAAAALPDAEVRWFSPADHDVHAQHPKEVAAALVDRFGQVDP
jgi:pimeloyl-ACP methyl ester carboxylesterase